MALPQSLTDLAVWLGLEDLTNLHVTCYYCGCYLAWHDKILYDNSNLNVIWREGAFYAVCYSCTKATARLDFMTHYSGVYSVAEIQLQYNCSLLELPVRCLGCLRELNRQEKTDVVIGNPDLFLVRDSIRTLCVVCRVGLQ